MAREVKTSMGNIVAIIQARMTSTRLPGKVLMDIAGKPALKAMLDRVRAARRIDAILVATTTNAEDDPVVALCQSEAVGVFRGSEADVLGRYFDAAVACDADVIVRLTADCPMIDPLVIDQAIDLYSDGRWDYVSNCNERTYPDGLDVEVFSSQALKVANVSATHPFAREHVTPYIRMTYPEFGAGDFRIAQLTFEADFSHVRWTLDLPDDLERIRNIVSQLPEEYSWLQALAVATKKPELLGVTG